MTSTSTRIVASVLKSRSKIRFPSLVVGNGNWLAFLAGKTCVDGISIRRRAFLCIPFIPSSNPGSSWPSPIVQASSLNSVSSFVEKYLTPPGSFCVANDYTAKKRKMTRTGTNTNLSSYERTIQSQTIKTTFSFFFFQTHLASDRHFNRDLRPLLDNYWL